MIGESVQAAVASAAQEVRDSNQEEPAALVGSQSKTQAPTGRGTEALVGEDAPSRENTTAAQQPDRLVAETREVQQAEEGQRAQRVIEIPTFPNLRM